MERILLLGCFCFHHNIDFHSLLYLHYPVFNSGVIYILVVVISFGYACDEILTQAQMVCNFNHEDAVSFKVIY